MLERSTIARLKNPTHQELNMCEANAYLVKEGKEELILEAVDKVENEGDHIKIESIFGEQKVVHRANSQHVPRESPDSD